MKRYVDGIGYIEVAVVEFNALPHNAVYFGSDSASEFIKCDMPTDDLMNYYITATDDTVYAVKAE